jgi:hypothetical protein
MDLPPVTPEVVFWLCGPPLASIAVALGALFTRRRAIRHVLFWVGLGGLIVSVLWILLALRVEAIEKRSLEGQKPLRGAEGRTDRLSRGSAERIARQATRLEKTASAETRS